MPQSYAEKWPEEDGASRLWLLIVAIAVVFLALGLGQRLFGDQPPRLYGQLVDEEELRGCLEAAEPAVDRWRVSRESEPLQADPATGALRVEWSRQEGLGLTVLADAADAAEVDSQLNGSVDATTSWANVVMRYSEDEPGLPPAVRDAVFACSETSAASAAPIDPTAFEDCGDLDDKDRIFGLAARGVSCGSATALARKFSMVSATCSSRSRENLCASFHLCCANSVLYFGGSDQAVIFESGI